MKKSCAGCKTPVEVKALIHTYNAKGYCSKQCIAQVRWGVKFS